MLHGPAVDILKKMFISYNIVQRKIYEMKQDVEDSICEGLKITQFSIQLDE